MTRALNKLTKWPRSHECLLEASFILELSAHPSPYSLESDISILFWERNIPGSF